MAQAFRIWNFEIVSNFEFRISNLGEGAVSDPPRVRRGVDALEPYVPGEQPRDPGIVKLNTNENPYPPSPRVAEALRAADVDALRRYPDPVCGRLREKLAEIHRCAPDQVFVGNGSDEVLALCARAFANRDGAIGYFEPSYSLYPVLAAIEEIRTAPVRLSQDFAWTMPGNYEASLFFLTNPNAPTSMLFPKKNVAAFCAGFPGVVVLDEAYVDFAAEDGMDIALSSDRALAARTLSKSYSLAGLRLGYAVGPAPLIRALDKIKDSYNVSRLAQDIALAALGDLGHMRRNVERIKATRGRVASALAARGFWVAPSETNFLWVRPAGMTAEDLFQRLRERKIVVRYFRGEMTGSHLRITVGTDGEMDRLVEAVDGIQSAV
jgi:histidinol-phosphate aminotransferase